MRYTAIMPANAAEYLANSLLRILASRGDLSDAALKRLYRLLCKRAHPDANREAAEGIFTRLTGEYERAQALLPGFREWYGTAGGLPDRMECRRLLYNALRNYSAAGLHSFKVRNKSALEVRNGVLAGDVRRWASLYDPVFDRLFAAYHGFRFQRFVNWKKSRRFAFAWKYFILGLDCGADAVRDGSEPLRRRAVSFLHDAGFLLSTFDDHPLAAAMRAIAGWAACDLEGV